MKRQMTIRQWAACGAAACAVAISASALAANLPPEHQQGTVAYRTGGIGEDEAAAMKGAEREYPLAIEFVARSGQDRGGYLADVDVAIKDSRGTPVLQARADGPFMLARLPAGRYVVAAMYGDTQRSQRVDISPHGTTRVIFGW